MARNLRNRANIAIRTAKADYIKEQLEFNRSDPKKFWNIIHTEILPKDNFKILKFKNEEEDRIFDQSELPNLTTFPKLDQN